MPTVPWITIHPPKASTRAKPTWGRFCMIGVKRARRSASFSYAQATAAEASVSWAISRPSWAKERTTRTPLTFSSVRVATSARRAWMIQEMGNMTWRIRMPAQNRNGITDMATRASGTLIESMKQKATIPMQHCTRISGANVAYICTERMSELAREMSWPDWTRS